MKTKNIYQKKVERYAPEVLDTLDEAGGYEVVLDFAYNLETKKAGYFDVVVWNIYALLVRHYKQKGLKGRDIWAKAHRHAVVIADSMSKVSVETEEHIGLGVNVLEYLLSLAKARKFAKIKLTGDFDIVFLDKNGGSIFEFSPKSLRKSHIIETAQTKIREEEEEQARIIKKGKKKIEARRLFSPLKPPKISEIVERQNFSILESIRLSGSAPRVIEDQFRSLDLCSGYVVELLMQEYGRDAVSRAGLIYYGKVMDAWNIKEQGLKNGGIEVIAGLLDTLAQRRNGKMRVKDRGAYYEGLGSFFENADNGNYPSLITAFHTDTDYTKQILAENESRPDEMKSYNSHILLCLGRGLVQKSVVRRKATLGYFVKNKANVAYALQRYLKIKVQRSNGDRIEVESNGKATVYKASGEVQTNVPMRKIWLSGGDEVQWQDVLVTDFYKGEERVMGLAYYATKRKHVLMENLILKNVPKREGGKYRIVDFVQVENEQDGGFIGEQLKEKLRLSESGLSYYLIALADSGIDLSRIAKKDLIPVFDMDDVRRKINAEGGISQVHNRILETNIEKYNKGSLEDMIISIKPGISPWETVEPLFANYFEGGYGLTSEERNFILRSIDDSCPNIDLSGVPPKFEAGDMLYLTWERVFEIAKRVREMQAESFSGDDYVKIIEAGDSPYAFIRDCFNIEAKELGIDLEYSQLGSLERAYLLKALQACSKDVDLTLAGKGRAKTWTNFKLGSRLVLRRDDLQKCVKDIDEKRKLQAVIDLPVIKVRRAKKELDAIKSAEAMGFKISDKSPYLTTVVPLPVRNQINEVYPGNNLKEALVRNILYFIWINEQSRGGSRSRIKRFLSEAEEEGTLSAFGLQKGVSLVKSIGPFQIRPLKTDMENCRKLFEKYGIKVPENFKEFRSMIKKDLRVSAIVAGQRVLESLNSFENFMKATGEDDVDLLNENLTLMVTTSFNRSPETIYRAVFQNWALNLASEAGVKSDVSVGEVDALLNKAGKRKRLEDHIINTFKRVAEKLGVEGDLDSELQKIRASKLDFVKGALFKELQKWYRGKTGKGLGFVFTNEELARGKGIFSYGARLFSTEGQWASVFKDYDELRRLTGKMKGNYKPEPYTSPPLPLKSPVSSILLEKKKKLKKLLKDSGISECYTKGEGIVTVYDRAIKLRSAPRGRKKTSLYFGTQISVHGIQKKGSEIWLKVRVIAGEKIGEEGFVAFRKEWFSNENAPTITPRLTRKLKKMEEDPDKPLPKDYAEKMNEYLRFLHNYNSEEPPKSAEMMKRSRPTAFEVKDKETIGTVRAVAKRYGYTNQKFFAILPKRGGGGLRRQALYVIDTENDRVTGFLISTGRLTPKTETPAGRYVASNAGFRALNYFGSHQGTYVEKYEGHRVTQFLGLIEKHKRKPVRASMTTGLIPIQRRGEIVESAGRYFHGTNRENHLGGQASGGCIRMANMDIIYLAALLNGSQMEFQVIENKTGVEDAAVKGIELARAELRQMTPPL